MYVDNNVTELIMTLSVNLIGCLCTVAHGMIFNSFFTLINLLIPYAHCRCRLWHCKFMFCADILPEVVKDVPNQGLVSFVSRRRFFCLSFVFLVASTSAISCLERLVS